MRSQQIKLAYGIGLIHQLSQSGVAPGAFVHEAQKSQDPQVQKIARAGAYALAQLEKLKSSKTAAADVGFKQFTRVLQTVSPGAAPSALNHVVKTAAATDDSRTAGKFIGEAVSDGAPSAYLRGFKFAEEMMFGPSEDKEEKDEEKDDEEEKDEESEAEDEEEKTAEEMGDEMGGDAAADMSDEDLMAQLEDLVASGEMSPEELASIMDEISAAPGAESGAPAEA